MEEVQDNGRTTEELATTATITITTTITTEAEDPIEVVTTPRLTGVVTITATQRLATTPQATAIRAMGLEEVEGKHGEGEVCRQSLHQQLDATSVM